jgi:hypothetical protein
MQKRVAALVTSLVVVVTLAGTATAATAPAASTGPVTAVAPTTTTVSGSVNPNGSATTWYVEYGTSSTYGTKTTSMSAGSGTTSSAVSASLASLKPGTTYHYRFVATSSAGTGHGADGILTTSSAPAAATSGATSVALTSATLNGTVDPSGRPTTWYFELGTTTSYGSKTPVKDGGSGSGATAVAAVVSGLTAGRTYHFRLVATSDAGTSHGSDRTFTSSAAPTVATTPASSVADTSARVNGTVNPNGQATTVSFEYGTSTSYGTKTPAASVGGGTSTRSVSAAVTGLAAGATYHVRVVAANALGTASGSDQTFTTPGPPAAHTGAPAGVTGTSATLTGTVDPAGHSTSWYFEFGPSTAYGTKTASQNTGSARGAGAIAVPIAALAPGMTYHVRLVATNAAGTSYGADIAFATAGPAVTISRSGSAAIYGRRVTLRGRVSSRQANATVSIFALRMGRGSFTAVARVLTGVDGTWSLSVRPPIRTTYKVLFGGGNAVTTVAVRPAVSLTARSDGRFATHVGGARSFAHRVVRLQRRRLDGSWSTVSRTRLSARSTAVFHPVLPHGRSTVRVAISAGQAGSGYAAGFSRRLAYRRH